jgi:chromosome segregation ATPase
VGQRKQLWILLSFFAVVGLFSGLAIWQISNLQQKDRDLARAKTELDQVTQQMQLLKDQNTATITSRGKLQKDLASAQKQLTTFQQQGLAIQQQLKTAQAQNSTLISENATLKVRLSLTEKQLESIQKSLNFKSSSTKPSPTVSTEPNFLKNP